MRPGWWMRPPVLASGSACGLAGLACAWALAGALRLAPAPAPPADGAAAASDRGGSLAASPTPAATDHGGTLDSDPFRADRRRPPRRFGLPGTPAPAARVAAPAVGLILTGTVVYPGGGGFALVRLPGRAPVMVRVGEAIEGHTLRALARDEATFARPGGGSVVLRVPKAGG